MCGRGSYVGTGLGHWFPGPLGVSRQVTVLRKYLVFLAPGVEAFGWPFALKASVLPLFTPPAAVLAVVGCRGYLRVVSVFPCWPDLASLPFDGLYLVRLVC